MLEQYFRHCFEERKRRLGEQARLLPFVGTIFPNTSYHGRQPRGLCAWHPHSPTSTGGWRFFLVDADAPAGGEGLSAPLLHALLGSGRDDRAGRHGELALRHRRPARGTIARRYPFNYQQSLGAWTREHAPLGGTVSLQVTEEIAARLLPRAGSPTWAAPTGTNCSAATIACRRGPPNESAARRHRHRRHLRDRPRRSRSAWRHAGMRWWRSVSRRRRFRAPRRTPFPGCRRSSSSAACRPT